MLLRPVDSMESPCFCGTPTPTPGIERLGLQTPTQDRESHSNYDSRTYCVT